MLLNIQKDSEWLIRMVENLLSVTRIENETMRISKTPTILDELIDSSVAKFSQRYPNQNVDVTVPEDIVVISVDSILIEQVILNLLENSLKYKDDPEVQVRIGCTETSSDATISVTDNGPGVPEEALSKLFDVFYRSDPSRSNPQKGSGLGLAITAKILERFGGSVRAENVRPKGLRILLTIPKEEAKS